MSRFLIILSAFLIVLGCSTPYLINKQENVKQKLVNRGVVFTPDTLYKFITKTDTVIDPITKEIRIIQTVVDSVPYSVDRLVYIPMSRHERKALRDSLKFANKNLKVLADMYGDSLKNARKMHNSDNRTNRAISRHENKCSWFWRTMGKLFWIWIILGIAAGLLISKYWHKIKGMFKK